MIKVSIFHGETLVDVPVDADDAAIVSPTTEVMGEDILVLEKAGVEVGWFRYWSYAVKEENIGG
jgi:hypothetical protein